jgi:alpha-glucuronidase
LWEEIVAHYDHGVAAAHDLGQRWSRLGREIDPRRFAEVSELLRVQEREAQWWRDACIAYFRSVSGLPMPRGTKAPPLTLEQYSPAGSRTPPAAAIRRDPRVNPS